MADETYGKFFNLHEKKFAAEPEDTLERITVDISEVVLDVIGRVPRLLEFRAEIKKQLPHFDLSHLDNLEGYTKGLGHAHALYLASKAPSTTVAELAAEADLLASALVEDGAPLARRGLIDREKYARLTEKVVGKRSNRSQVFRLIGLVELVRAGGDAVLSNSAITKDELARAEAIAAQLGDAIGLRTAGAEEESESSDAALMRRRAFTLFFRAYDQVRKAISYLRWEAGDADSFAPSLYAGRGTGGQTDPAAEDPASKDAAAKDAAKGSSDLKRAAEPTPGAQPTAPKPIIKPGFPGGDPFEPGTDESLK